jgi:hypothetical protein
LARTVTIVRTSPKKGRSRLKIPNPLATPCFSAWISIDVNYLPTSEVALDILPSDIAARGNVPRAPTVLARPVGV